MKKHVLFITLLALMAAQVRSQVIQVTDTAATGTVDARANDHLIPGGPLGFLIWDQEICNLGNFIPGLYGNDFATICRVHAIERDESYPHPHRVSSHATSRAMINGNNSQALRIKWKNHGANYARTDGHEALISTTLDFSVDMAVTGIPAGTPVIVYWRYDIFGAGSTEHEDLPFSEEDSIEVVNTMTVNGVSQLQNFFNFSSANGLPGWNEWKNRTGNFRTTAGSDFSFAVTSSVRLRLQIPGKSGAGYPVDENDGIFRGEIVFSVVPLNPPVSNNVADSASLFLFSVDIGSDAEISDPQMDGNELFDPGDLYPGVIPSGPAPVAWKDDLLIFGHDPAPRPSFPFDPAPVGSGMPVDLVRSAWFDLDGSDLLAASLANLAYGPGQPSIPWFADSCIHEAEYLFVSFEDDTPEFYTSPGPPSVPVNSFSPVMGSVYSGLGERDEVMEYDLDAFPGSGTTFEYKVFSEAMLHSGLAPNPPGSNGPDDDADALDLIPVNGSTTPCTQWYISVDHEAAYNHPTIGAPFLNPGYVYQVTPAGPVPVVTLVHTGLIAGADLRDFEFAWVWDTLPAIPRFGLALLFSVAPDDPLTSEDETGGLNPHMIYYSFLNGISHQFSADFFRDPIDGLTVWKNSLNGTQAFPNPVWGTKTWTGSANDNWAGPLNWFPQGVPFDPEDVTIPDLSPGPVVGGTGFDCDDLFISKGAILTIKPGSGLTVQGAVVLEGP